MRTLDLVLRHGVESGIQQKLLEKIKTISLPFLQMMLGSDSEATTAITLYAIFQHIYM